MIWAIRAGIDDALKIEIFNSNGQCGFSDVASKDAINISNWVDGLYSVKVTFRDQIMVRKLIIQ